MSDPGPVELAGESYCYLTTTGRRSGEPRTIEIWFALAGGVLYMLAGGGQRSHWVRNIQRDPAVRVRIGSSEFVGAGRLVPPGDEDALARKLLFEKYAPGYRDDFTSWAREALPVAIDLAAAG